MSNPRTPNSIFLVLVSLGAVQFFYYLPRLPDVVGSHFAGSGFVNGWQRKTAFFSMD
jgi:hypothetical protein